MNAYDPADRESTDTELDQRDVRALTEYLTVLPEAPGIYSVVSESGASYTVDGRDGACTCPDFEYRDIRCKHLRRVAFAIGERPLPAWIDRDAIDEHLGAHVDGTPRVAATDGGVIEAGDEGEALEDGAERPEACTCHPAWDEDAPPCWPCYREGFDAPNPNAEPDD